MKSGMQARAVTSISAMRDLMMRAVGLSVSLLDVMWTRGLCHGTYAIGIELVELIRFIAMVILNGYSARFLTEVFPQNLLHFPQVKIVTCELRLPV